jgi:hypothetical protein
MTGQGQFAAALTDPTQPVPPGLVSPRGTPDAKRFAVYRNNVHVSLVGALVARFPVTRQVVGEAFFAGMARLYVGEQKPKTPVLLHYGDSFPAFIATFPPAAAVPYLPDLARLEAAWSQSYNAAEARVLTPADLGRITPEKLSDLRLRPAPATRLVPSAWPIGSIWSAHQQASFRPPSATGPEAVLLTRPAAEVRLTIVPQAAATLLEILSAGETLGAAISALEAQFPPFDPGSTLVGLASLGAFSSLPDEVHHAS